MESFLGAVSCGMDDELLHYYRDDKISQSVLGTEMKLSIVYHPRTRPVQNIANEAEVAQTI